MRAWERLFIRSRGPKRTWSEPRDLRTIPAVSSGSILAGRGRTWKVRTVPAFCLA